jgi:hypothetical protein
MSCSQHFFNLTSQVADSRSCCLSRRRGRGRSHTPHTRGRQVPLAALAVGGSRLRHLRPAELARHAHGWWRLAELACRARGPQLAEVARNARGRAPGPGLLLPGRCRSLPLSLLRGTLPLVREGRRHLPFQFLPFIAPTSPNPRSSLLNSGAQRR